MNHTKQGRRASRLAFYGVRQGPLVIPPSLLRTRPNRSAELRFVDRDGVVWVLPIVAGDVKFGRGSGETLASLNFSVD